ncbi:hypothetical protein [Winogradskyella sp.]|uniref:hypothetical protein n=1 Tax=Winogradskyella sp. TaxID=1883156 RepID=UPI0025CF9B52|nr:hypothetical protein [Winogradskyella sp.]MBT8245598.1 hypothetical protein [Winogradskyella sp.]
MKIIQVIKGITIILFFVILAGAYLKLFKNYQIIEGFTLYNIRYVLGGIYILIRIVEYIIKKKK